MEQWEPYKKTKRGAGFKKFLYETFRPHSIAEYSAFFTRGLNGDKDKTGAESEYTAYPFVYARVFVVLLLLFGISAQVLLLTGNYISYPVVSLFGGLIMNLPLLTLIYELYPLKNISLPFVAAVALIGGTAATLLIQLVYFIYVPGNDVVDAFYVGLVEEVFKAVPVFIVIKANKKRTPFLGLIAGFAVGAGMSTIEDVGYIFNYGMSGYGIDYSMFVTVALTRGVTAICTHIAWTGLIGYAFAKYAAPLKNPRFYAYAVTCVVLHSLWDLPADIVGELVVAAFYLICTVVALVLIVRAIRGERRLVNQALHPLYALITQPEQLEIADVLMPSELAEEGATSKKCGKKLMFANTLIGLCSVVLAFCGIASCIISDSFVGYDYRVFDTAEEMLAFVQDGASFNAVPDRKYRKFETPLGLSHINDYSYGYVDGRLSYATQRVIDTYAYFYDYSFTDSAEGVLTNVSVVYDGVHYDMQRTSDGICYFAVNRDVYDVTRDTESGKYYVDLNDTVLYAGEIIGVVAVMAVSLVGILGGAAIMITDKRNKNREDNKC